jgi:hypothetical protein
MHRNSIFPNNADYKQRCIDEKNLTREQVNHPLFTEIHANAILNDLLPYSLIEGKDAEEVKKLLALQSQANDMQVKGDADFAQYLAEHPEQASEDRFNHLDDKKFTK